MKTLTAILAAVAAAVVRALIADWRAEQKAREAQQAEALLRIREVISDARKTVDQRSISVIRERLHKHAASKH